MLVLSMFIRSYKHKVEHIIPLVVLALIACLFLLLPEAAEALGYTRSESLLKTISYRSQYCDTDECVLPVTSSVGALIEFSYCPENSCYQFSMIYSAKHDLFYDFVLMYLYYKSDYIYLKDVKEKYWKEHIDVIAGKYISGSKGPFSESVIDCVLYAMAERNDILVSFVRRERRTRHMDNIKLKDCKWK